MRLVSERCRLDDVWDEASHRIDHDHRRQLPAGQHEVADGKLLVDVAFDDALVDALVMPAHDDEMRQRRETARGGLIEERALRGDSWAGLPFEEGISVATAADQESARGARAGPAGADYLRRRRVVEKERVTRRPLGVMLVIRTLTRTSRPGRSSRRPVLVSLAETLPLFRAGMVNNPLLASTTAFVAGALVVAAAATRPRRVRRGT